jgi:hypothetical protein
MKRVDIRTAIYTAIDETDAATEKYMVQIMKWAKYIERSIGSFHGYPIKAKTETVTGCTLMLPDDCYRPLELLPGDYEDECNVYYLAIDPQILKEDVREDEITLTWLPMNSTRVSPKYWTMTGEQLNLLREYEGQEMTLVYQYIETTLDGYWIVNESHLEAISRYIKYKLADKYNWRVYRGDKLLRNSHLEYKRELKDEYNESVRNARALDAEDDPYEKGLR